MEMKIEQLQTLVGVWVAQQTKIIACGPEAWEIKTSEIDAYGDDILLFLERQIDGSYLLGDDGRMLFKLDPGFEEQELWQNAAAIAVGSGYDFDEKTATISCRLPKDALPGAIIRLAQLEVAISYLA